MPREVHVIIQAEALHQEEQWALTAIRPTEPVEVLGPPLNTIDHREAARPIEALLQEQVLIGVLLQEQVPTEVLHLEQARIEVLEAEAAIPIAEVVEALHQERATIDHQAALEAVAVPIEVLDAVVVFQEVQEVIEVPVAQEGLPLDQGQVLLQVDEETKSEIIINLP